MSKTSYRRRVSPKLRMIANGSETVNTIRAEFAPSVRVATKAKLPELAEVRALTAETVARSDLPASVKRGSLKEPPSTVEASVFVELEDSRDVLPAELRKYAIGRREDLCRRQRLRRNRPGS